MHRSPHSAVGKVLVKQMIGAVVVHHAIWVIHPFSLLRKVYLGAMGFIVGDIRSRLIF
jgi:hypothetical protein